MGDPSFNFAVQDAITDELMGMVEANYDWSHIDGLSEGDANVSYGLYPQYRGHGFVARALTLLHTYLSESSIKRSVIRVEPENKASLAVPRRLGYREEVQ
jgi:RimJ/RimL family protein N-acetyltransferase